MTKRPIALLFLLSGVSGLLAGQTPPPQLSLADAQALALKNHPQVLASQALSLRADKITTEAKSAYYPALNGEITGAQANVGSRLGAGYINAPALFNHFGTGLTLSQLITDSGRTPNLVANAKLRAEASREDFRATQYDVTLGVNQAYYETLLAQQLVRVAQQTVATRQTVVDQISELTRQKLRSTVDLSFAEVNLADARLMQLRAQDRLQSAYAVLGQALGTQESIPYQLTEQPMPSEVPADVAPLLAQAFQTRPELASLHLQLEADQKFAFAERDLKRPTVSLTAVGGVLPYINPGSANPNIPAGYEAVAVNVNIPIFDGHLFTARQEAAEYEVQATRQRSRDEQDRIARDVRVSWTHARTAFEAISTARQLLNHANLALDLAQSRYNLGLASIVELTQAQLGQTSAEVESLNAKYEYQEAYAALQYTLGLLH